jgi:(p)ppGpp synthase/HD superfamily hydrolase
LCEAEYSATDIDCVRAAYELALRLFTGLYRGSGKPFLAHLVGTASILASVRARGPVVAAGLLHAAYTQGEFGNGWGGVAPEKRRRLQEAVGPEAEELVRQYTLLGWNERTIPKIHLDFDTLDYGARDVLHVWRDAKAWAGFRTAHLASP